ncbi:MAG: sulfatase [Bacteroidales bacterium]|nr:sulfatase [Bacteroidales bacterium]
MNKLILLVNGAFLFTFCAKPPEEKLNVLMIAVDDLRPELGCYGNGLIQTPNIDKLASRGVTFTNSFCNIPVCGASRASLMTGSRPTRHRFLTYFSRADAEVPDKMVLSQHFKNNGYHTISNGKVLHEFEDHAPSWDENWRLQTETGWLNYLLDENKEIEKKEGRGPAYEVADVHDTVYNDGKLAIKTIADLKRLKDKGEPFFLATGFVKPHLPFNAPVKYWDLYEASDFSTVSGEFLPENAPGEAFHQFEELRQYHGIPKSGPLSDSLSVTLQHGYYACVSYIDAQIGLILQALDELGLTKNTIVLLWGDHGWNLGEHGLWCKHCNFNTSLSAPLIISAPGKVKDAKCQAMAEFIDIYPTLSELCGLEIPETVEGTSLVHLLENPAAEHKDFVVCKYKDGLTLRTEKYAYTEWSNDDDVLISRMLYDHHTDPAETDNIVNNTENKALVDSLQKVLHENRGHEYFKKNP